MRKKMLLEHRLQKKVAKFHVRTLEPKVRLAGVGVLRRASAHDFPSNEVSLT